MRLHKYFGVELETGRTVEEKRPLDQKMGKAAAAILTNPEWRQGNATVERTGSKLRTYSFDALGYYPLDAAKKLELIGSVGLVESKVNTTFYGKVNDNSFRVTRKRHETKLRLGLDAQVEAFDNFRVRAMLRWNGGDFEGIVNNVYTASLGFNYSF